MKKILIIADREFRAIVGTKAFLFSIAIMPVMMFGSMYATQALQNTGKIDEKRIAVIDHSGQYVGALQFAATQNNQALAALAESTTVTENSTANRSDTDSRSRSAPPSISKGSKYLIEVVDPAVANDDLMLQLSNRVRIHDLDAFVEIPSDILKTNEAKIFSEDSGLSSLNFWISNTINERTKAIRFEQIGLDADEVRMATQRVEVKGLGLVQKTADGNVKAAEEKDQLTAIFLPFIAMMLMFMVIFMSSQPMLEAVLEEKSQRIAEVLLGCASPTQLMAGKLLGSVGGSLTIIALYLGGAFFAARHYGMTDRIPFDMVPWFIAFQILGVMFYAAIFMAVGASVSQLKEAQALLLPVWMLLMSPLFVWFYIVQDPRGPLAVWFSLIPPATPTTMAMRLTSGVTIPVWQPILGIVLLLLSTIFCVFVAGRIFRVGILWQGKTPKLTEILRWAISG